MKKPHLILAKAYWQAHLKPSDLAIDATCGNGHDTLFLSRLCRVIGLDIQETALKNTEALLLQSNSQALLHLISHAEIDALPLPCPPRLIVYNLGYLPRGDKTFTTQTETSLISVKKSLALLAKDGALSITCYPGREEGKKEEAALINWAQSLPKEHWFVCFHQWLNRPHSPSLLWIAAL